MKAQDLRIGNIVNCKAYLSAPAKVMEIMHSGDDRGHYLRLEGVPHGVWLENKGKPIVEGVPLTEELLVKLGFEKHITLDVHPTFAKNRFNVNDGRVYISGLGFVNHIKYIHQLQNLYFALTNQELTLNNKS